MFSSKPLRINASSFQILSGIGIAHSLEVERPFIAALGMKDREKEQRKEAVNMLLEKQKKSQPNILMTVKDVATYLSVTERTVYRLVKDHRLPAYKVGGQWRFKAEMIEAWMQKDGAMDNLAQASANPQPEPSQYAWKVH